jgi:hypothetical protein
MLQPHLILTRESDDEMAGLSADDTARNDDEHYSSDSEQDRNPLCAQLLADYELLQHDHHRRVRQRQLAVHGVLGSRNSSQPQSALLSRGRPRSIQNFSEVPTARINTPSGCTLRRNLVSSSAGGVEFGPDGVQTGQPSWIDENTITFGASSGNRDSVDITATEEEAAVFSEQRHWSSSSPPHGDGVPRQAEPVHTAGPTVSTHGAANAAGAGFTGQHMQQGRKRKNGNWSDSALRATIDAIDDGLPIRRASEKFGIPRATLHDWLYERTISRKRGKEGTLTASEEALIVQWICKRQDLGWPITNLDLRLKVCEITQTRPTLFKDGIPGPGWLRWWKRRHPELTLRVPQGLETARTRALSRENVDSFYDNLEILYSLNSYPPDRIWNCDETGAQAGRDGGGMVIAKRGSRAVHTIIPDQREWLSCLVCINAAGSSIPSFYIFRGKRFRRNYIEHCEAGATMAMQGRAWMTAYLFSAWISHFIESVRELGGISPARRHLFILDGHNSHVTLEVVREARRAGLDLLTLPSHTSHALQPLDVTVFKPFKTHFREYRNFWTSRNMHQKASKETLAQWVSLGLRKALSVHNITKGFQTTGIFSLNRKAVDSKLMPSINFETEQEQGRRNVPTGAAGDSVPTAEADSTADGDAVGICGSDQDDQAEAFGIPDCTDPTEETRGGLEDVCNEDLEASFTVPASTEIEHYFVDVDPNDPGANDVGGFERE